MQAPRLGSSSATSDDERSSSTQGSGAIPWPIFAFNFEVPDHKWLELYCRLCMPGSSQPTPYTIRLGPSQFVRFTLPLSTFVAADPRTGDSIGLQTLHGRILVELQVPTPPDAKENWPGYVHASVSFP